MPGVGVNLGVAQGGEGSQPRAIQLQNPTGLDIQNPLTQQVVVSWSNQPPVTPYGINVTLRNEVNDELGSQTVSSSPATFFDVQLGAEVHADLFNDAQGDPNYINSSGTQTGSLIVS